uniref:Uncharacterized protein n=1 Tax=Panagrolaimus superbus TaxID=310955 RepID=A0A914Z4N9_9BILA
MVVAGYLLYNTNMRVKDENGYRFLGLPNGPPSKGLPTVSSLKERAELVFQLVPEKMKNLVIIDSTLSSFEMIQACAEVAEKYAKKIMVIPSLLARLTYALEYMRDPPKNEILLVITLTSAFVEFVILRRNQKEKLYISECESYESNKCNKMFGKYYNQNTPDSTIFVVHKSLSHIVDQIRHRLNPKNCFIRSFDKWDYVLLFGGMLRAMDDEDGFDSKYHIPNFSNGYETIVQNRKTKIDDRHVLLPERSALPCNIHGFDGVSQKIKLYYPVQYYYVNNEHALSRRYAIEKFMPVSFSSKKAIGYVDERGVPYVYKNGEVPKKFGSLNQSVSKSFSQSMPLVNTIQTSVISPQIKFLFCDNFFSIEVHQNGITKLLKDSFDNEWTPMYLSTVKETPEIGENAKTHYQRFSKHVIYDVLKIIGKPLNQIMIDPKWGFELTEINGSVYFQVETPSGTRLFSQEIVIAAFLKSMKLRIESTLESSISAINVSTNFELNESQKSVFQKAAAKNNLKILCFFVRK